MQTVKQSVIDEAQRNPFQSVADIAEKCSTQKVYVRNVLSHEGLSLLDLRKSEYEHLQDQYQMALAELEQLKEQVRFLRTQNLRLEKELRTYGE